MQWLNEITAFFSGVAISLFGAIVANIIQKRNNAERIKKETRFEVYMKLMEIYGLYWEIYMAELHKEEYKMETKHKLWSLSWQIADKVREYDKIEYIEDIMSVLFNKNFKTAKDRYYEIKSILDKLGHKINPKYNKLLNEISEQNEKLLIEQQTTKSNAPGFYI